jgi:type IV pilus assembly protein PilE
MKIQKGFTLIELMIVVVIVGILAAIAVPSYRQYIVKSNRAAAESFMLQAANREEQIMLDMRGYVAVTANANFPNLPTAGSPGINLTVPDNVSQFYDIVITLPVTASYTITATAKGTQTSDTNCLVLTLNQAGAKTPVTGCW